MKSNAHIRIANSGDAASILKIYAPYIKTPVTFEEQVPSLSEFQQRIEKIRKTYPYLVCEIDGKIAGYAYASEYRERASYRWNSEVSVYVMDEFKRKNIAKALYTALFEILKKQNFVNLLAIITLPNKESVTFHERMGFKPCGVFNKVGYKLGKWHQVGWWERSFVIDENHVQEEPIPFSKLKNKGYVDEILLRAASIITI